MSAETMNAEINLQAAAWIEQRDRDEWSDADQAGLDSWLAQSPSHRAAFWRLEAAWKDSDRLTAFHPVARREAKPRFTLPVFKSVAALAVIAICGAATTAYVMTPDWKTYSTTVGGREILTLGDGTKIELNTDSVIRVAQSAHERKVWLDKGEAYFEVTHDASRPFAVMVGNRRITDLGTKFLVRSDSDQLKVAVLDGRVQIEEKNGEANPTVLTAGDVVVAARATLTRSRTPTKELESALGWRNGVLVFDNRTLADVAAEFNRYNARKLIVADGKVGQTRIAGTFRADNIDAFVNTAHRVLGLHVEKRGEDIAISH
ncbi:MAG TPA: FecR domain-containing protein [Rhizomicrobium sp.]|jgi:transmembrane sensor